MSKAEFDALLSPCTLAGGIVLNNRVVMAPMTHSSSNPDGTVSEQELAYYARRSMGVGAVITACAYVNKGGKGFYDEFGADRDDLVPGLRKLAETIQAAGAKAILQIFHGGRECPPELLPDGQPVSASDVAPVRPGGQTGPAPRPLTEEEITGIIADFGEATRRAIEAGFNGVEIHGANGYLIQQFFSPHSNLREDRWGGSLENRLAFPLAVLREVKAVVAKHAAMPFIVGYRFSPEEAETPGLTMSDTFALLDALAEEGVDYLHVSLRKFDSLPHRGTEDSRPALRQIVDRVAGRAPVIGVGSLYTAEAALQALEETGADLVALGRPLLIDPDWVQKVEEGRAADIETELDPDGQQRLVIPQPLWNMLVNTPGWLPMRGRA
ncbi:NADH-dependent flavin oxidoreductase [Paenibacillus glufosinatiresistens]|uniref:NADH-dependent flavin oxidoreductase n=1 Tax=Paenibacillus glufosinatiresistens TaxID=3070657 RepID=UPI00286EA2E3|nr:NADH-dependent flavin oxidoreductase [Paenibacillus sp. YX.27]